MRFTQKIGVILLAIFLIVYALVQFGLIFPNLNILLGALALAAGIFLLIDR